METKKVYPDTKKDNDGTVCFLTCGDGTCEGYGRVIGSYILKGKEVGRCRFCGEEYSRPWPFKR